MRAPKSTWSVQQIDALRARYPHERTENILDATGHSLDSTKKMACKLKIKKTALYVSMVRSDQNPDSRIWIKPNKHSPQKSHKLTATMKSNIIALRENKLLIGRPHAKYISILSMRVISILDKLSNKESKKINGIKTNKGWI